MQTIFIIDPDKVLLESYAHALAKKNRQVVTFRTANLAVRALEKYVPDIVVLELALPAHNGFEFLYELRSYADTRDVRVVVHSFIEESKIPWGFVNREDFGIIEYMHKPHATVEDLKRVVNAVA